LSFTGHPVKLWVSANFAPAWLDDAINEALVGKDRNSRRREIIFSVCFVESYLVEWLRNEVFKNIEKFLEYSPIKQRIGIVEKWKNILKDLHSKNLIPNKPYFNQTYWQEWKKLVEFRDGLIHAVASLPEGNSEKPEDKPIPSPNELSSLSPGWATKTVINLVTKLHEFADTNAPDWFIEKAEKLNKNE
jgi:hypothetical protein